LFVSYPSSYVLFKDRKTLTMFSRYEKECNEWKVWDLGFITPFLWSRWFESLWIWLFIKTVWIKWIEKIILDREDNAKYAEKLILESSFFITLHNMDFYRMAFVYCPKLIYKYIVNNNITNDIKNNLQNLIDNYNHKINQRLYESGELCLDEYKLHDVWNKIWLWKENRYTVMAVTIWNPLYTKKSIKKSLSILFNEAIKNEKAILSDFYNIINFKKNNDYKKSNHHTWPAGW
jgi:hypothetical protein